MQFVLILTVVSQLGVSTSMGDFNDEAACQKALQTEQTLLAITAQNVAVKGVCMPKASKP